MKRCADGDIDDLHDTQQQQQPHESSTDNTHALPPQPDRAVPTCSKCHKPRTGTAFACMCVCECACVCMCICACACMMCMVCVCAQVFSSVLVTCPCVCIGALATHGHKRVMVKHVSVCDKKCTATNCKVRGCVNNAAQAMKREARNRKAQLAGFQAPEDERLVKTLKESMKGHDM